MSPDDLLCWRICRLYDKAKAAELDLTVVCRQEGCKCPICVVERLDEHLA